MKAISDSISRVFRSGLFYIFFGAVVASIGVIGIISPGGLEALSAFNTLIGGYIIGLGTAIWLIFNRQG